MIVALLLCVSTQIAPAPAHGQSLQLVHHEKLLEAPVELTLTTTQHGVQLVVKALKPVPNALVRVVVPEKGTVLVERELGALRKHEVRTIAVLTNAKVVAAGVDVELKGNRAAKLHKSVVLGAPTSTASPPGTIGAIGGMNARLYAAGTR